MGQLLDAAADVFARVGYERATTNAIAAEAGVSPGSLYQFFPNKAAVAEALAARFVEQLRGLQEDSLSPDLARLPLDRALDRMIDPLVAFNLANPACQALLRGPDVPHGVTRATQRLYEDGLGRIDAVLAALAPRLSGEERARRARVLKHVTAALLPLILAAEPAEREHLVGELKGVLRGYLSPLVASRPPA